MNHAESDTVFERFSIEIDCRRAATRRRVRSCRSHPGVQFQRTDAGVFNHPDGIQLIHACKFCRRDEIQELPVERRVELEIVPRAPPVSW